MALRPHVSHSQNQVLCELPLEGQIVLVGKLCPQVRLKFPEQQHRPEVREIHAARASRGTKTRSARSLLDDAGERIWSVPASLEFKRKIKQRAGQE
jgi:hypothetical protein